MASRILPLWRLRRRGFWMTCTEGFECNLCQKVIQGKTHGGNWAVSFGESSTVCDSGPGSHVPVSGCLPKSHLAATRREATPYRRPCILQRLCIPQQTGRADLSSLLENSAWLCQPLARHSRAGGNPVILGHTDNGSPHSQGVTIDFHHAFGAHPRRTNGSHGEARAGIRCCELLK
jgi:hypothetical protein